MNLRQWTRNDDTINKMASQDGTCAEAIAKVLGLVWNSNIDTLSLSLDKLIQEIHAPQSITKRSVLSLSSKLFDPLGFVESVSAKGKIMMQELWKMKMLWDTELPHNYREKWLKWLSEIKGLTSLPIPRQYLTNDNEKAQLHIFCDSSQLAYGAVAYLRGTTTNTCSFVMLKSKVAPLKEHTLPRLELLAALLGAELWEFLSQTLQPKLIITEYYMWSDSQIVLAWIKSSKPLQQQFIQTRVAKIKDTTSSSHWEYCPTASNPADLLTRGMDGRTFLSKTTSWFKGPSWLPKEKTEWPELQHTKIQEQEHEETESAQTISYLATTAKSSNLLNVIDIVKHGTLTKAIRVTATVMKFISRLRKGPELETQITSPDMKKALAALIRAVQQSAYSGIITQLQTNRMTNLPPLVGQLGLYIDEQQLLRCRGLLKNALMIGLMKSRLKKTIERASLNAVELATMLTEIEATLNSRPLTYTYGDIDDGPPLTPSHFLCGHRLLALPCPESTGEDPEYLPNDLTPNEFTKKFRYHQRLMQMLWRQWRNEYLTSLREHPWTRRASYKQKIKVGDVLSRHHSTKSMKFVSLNKPVLSEQQRKLQLRKSKKFSINVS